jgi:hypothetical protein
MNACTENQVDFDAKHELSNPRKLISAKDRRTLMSVYLKDWKFLEKKSRPNLIFPFFQNQIGVSTM